MTNEAGECSPWRLFVCLALSCVCRSCLVLRRLVLPRLVVSCLVASCRFFVASGLVLSCPGLPRFALCFFALPCVVLLVCFEVQANCDWLVLQNFMLPLFSQKNGWSLFLLKLNFVKDRFAKKCCCYSFLLKRFSSKVLLSLALPCHDSPCPGLSCSSCLVWRSCLDRGWLPQLLFWMLAVCVLHAPCCQLVSLSLGQLKRRATR